MMQPGIESRFPGPLVNILPNIGTNIQFCILISINIFYETKKCPDEGLMFSYLKIQNI